MLGLGILKGLAVTFRHYVETYTEDLKYFPRRYSQEALATNQSVRGKGIFTVQYPEEELAVPENYRFVPFLVYDEGHETALEGIRCTACGICSKVCPPQCIWIVRARDEKGKLISKPEQFHIDIDVCMNCGFCAEFCPFDSIVMDHEWKLADYERHLSHVYDLNKLLKPSSYYQSIRPAQYASCQAERAAKAAKKREDRSSKEEKG
jgi:NADH-quinone oxidoreductase subunit I